MSQEKEKTNTNNFIILFAVAVSTILLFTAYFLPIKKTGPNKGDNFSQEILKLIPDKENTKNFLQGNLCRISGNSFLESGVSIQWKEIYSLSYRSAEKQEDAPAIIITFAKFSRDEIELVDQLLDLFEYQEQGYRQGEILITPSVKIEESGGIMVEKISTSIIGERVVAIKYSGQRPDAKHYTIMFYKKDVLVILSMQNQEYGYDLLIDLAKKTEQKI